MHIFSAEAEAEQEPLIKKFWSKSISLITKMDKLINSSPNNKKYARKKIMFYYTTCKYVL